MIHRRLLPILLALLLTAPIFGANVGEIVLVRNSVRGLPPGGADHPLTVGEGVVLGLHIETGADSGTKMTFDPSGSYTLGAKTRAVIDSGLVDSVTGRSESALSVLAGTIRLALGKLFHGDVSIDTPTAVVGVKGTDLSVHVDEASGTTTVVVTEGTVTVRSKAGGEVIVTAGRRTLVAPRQPPTPTAPILPTDSTLTASAGGPAFTLPQETAFPESPIAGRGRDAFFFPREQGGVIFH